MALVFLGIDPGLSGAIAVVCGRRLIVRDVPTVSVKVGKTTKRRVDSHALAAVLKPLVALGVDFAMTENVNGWARPKRRGKAAAGEPEKDAQSASAAFAFGKVAGQLEQALACYDVPFETVAPNRWKRALGLIDGAATPAQRKKAARALAAKVFPEHAKLFARVKDDGRAEAALIAHYCRETYAP